jgi:hypothetical protein
MFIGKCVSLKAMNVYRGSAGHRNMSSSWWRKVSVTPFYPTTEKSPRHPFDRGVKGGWVREPLWTFKEKRKISSMKCSRVNSHVKMRKEKYLALAGHGSRDLPARSLATILNLFINMLQIGECAGVVVKALTTNRQVAVLIPDCVNGIFQWHKPSGRTMVLGST